jgi:hypothetical protein
VRLAWAKKARSEPPTADNVLFGFLVAVLSLMSVFAFCMHRAMQPIVLKNAGTAVFETDKSVAIMLASRPPLDEIERSELAAARLDNASQGLPNVARASHEQTEPAQRLANARSRTPPKSKRVARVRRPPTGPIAQHAWAFAPMGARSFGGFGGWHR